MTVSEYYDLYLSYSGRKSYKECPKMYEYSYILKPLVPRDPRSSFFGTAIGKVFEWFYARRIWTDPNYEGITLGLIKPAIQFTFEHEKWDPILDPSMQVQLVGQLREFISPTLDTIRTHKLLTSNSRSEVNLMTHFKSNEYNITLRLGGRADFIHGPKDDIWIIDGKASRHRDKYVDSDQLIWYAVQHYIKYHVAPTRLAFMYYQFPKDPIQWVYYGKQTMRDSIKDTVTISKQILAKEFPTKPSSRCYSCNYHKICEDGRKYISERKVAADSRIESSIFDLETIG